MPSEHRSTRRQLLQIGGATVLASGAIDLARRGSRGADEEPISVALLEDDLPRLQPLLEAYARRTGVPVVADAQPIDVLYTRVSISLTQATKAYDLVSILDTWLPQFAAGKLLADLGNLSNDDEDQAADFFPAQLALGVYPDGGMQYAVPWSANAQLFAWRSDLLDQLGLGRPRTWIDLLACVHALEERRTATGVAAYAMRGRDPVSASLTHLPLLRGLGREVIDPATGESQLATPEAMMAIDDLVALAAAVPSDPGATGAAELAGQLRDGAVAMTADLWADQLFDLLDPASPAAGRVEIGPQPSRPWIPPASVTGSWLLAVPKGSGRGKQARELARWLTAPEQQRTLLRDGHVLPTRTSLYKDAALMTEWPFLATVRELIANAGPRPRSPLYPQVEEIHGRYVREAILGTLDGAEAMRKAHIEIHELMLREGVVEGE